MKLENIAYTLLIQLITYHSILSIVYVAECPPLGMESHKIEPDQLTASSMSQYSFAPQRARLNMQVHNNQSRTAYIHYSYHLHTAKPQNKHQLLETCRKILLLLSLSFPLAALAVYVQQCLNQLINCLKVFAVYPP